MTKRNQLIAAMSPIITEAESFEAAEKNLEELCKIAKEFGGYQFTKLVEIEKEVYAMQFAFTNLDMYNSYIAMARSRGLL